MGKQENIDAWLATAPAEVRNTTARLLSEVAQMRENGQTIYPPQDDILNALAWTAPADVHAVILGQDPYHEEGQAMGLSFSVHRGCKLPPSLRNIYKELVADLGCETPATGDLSSWARQGVLLLNTTLTVRQGAANSHAKLGWKTLTDHIVRECLLLPQPVVFLAWGRHAVKLVEDAKAALGPRVVGEKPVIASTHPSPLSANREGGGLSAFMGSHPFSRANDLLIAHGASPIDWTLDNGANPEAS